MNRNFRKLVFNGIAIAMGVAVIVGNIAGPMSLSSATSALAIGVVALGMAGLQKES